MAVNAQTQMNNMNSDSNSSTIRVACIGNSIQYFNDCPRLLQTLSNGKIDHQDSCLRGGVSLVGLFQQGNGMRNKFRTPNARIDNSDTYDIGASTISQLLGGGCNESNDNEVVNEDKKNVKQQHHWDFAIMNDHTQHAARTTTRHETIQSLLSNYVPLFQKQPRCTPIFLMTAAYRRVGALNSQDLGTFDEFTSQTLQGYLEYANVLSNVLPSTQKPRIAPVGLAYAKVKQEDLKLWERLYHHDDFHPSPHGTFLQACVLYYTIFGCIPDLSNILEEIDYNDCNNENDVEKDKENVSNQRLNHYLWGRVRMMQPISEEPCPRPTYQEALYLIEVARRVCMEFQKLNEEDILVLHTSNL